MHRFGFYTQRLLPNDWNTVLGCPSCGTPAQAIPLMTLQLRLGPTYKPVRAETAVRECSRCGEGFATVAVYTLSPARGVFASTFFQLGPAPPRNLSSLFWLYDADGASMLAVSERRAPEGLLHEYLHPAVPLTQSPERQGMSMLAAMWPMIERSWDDEMHALVPPPAPPPAAPTYQPPAALVLNIGALGQGVQLNVGFNGNQVQVGVMPSAFGAQAATPPRQLTGAVPGYPLALPPAPFSTRRFRRS